MFSRLDPTKASFCSAVAESLIAVPGVYSVTFTGSFVENVGFSGIGDIDVVAIVQHMDATTYESCRAAIAAIRPELHSLPRRRLIINDTFGPLKFDVDEAMVVHLMIYDRNGHRDHVLRSPFTCFDWERSPYHVGASLREIYPTLTLQPRHFREARRGLASYLEDLAAGCISYRRYVFADDHVSEQVERMPLNLRQKGEFAYHIVRNLVGNYAKLILHDNIRLETQAMLEFWRCYLPITAQFGPWFLELERRKRTHAIEFPSTTLKRAKEFLEAVSDELDGVWQRQATKHLFSRHARTALNNGSFLGQRRDPEICERPAPLEQTPLFVFTSPSLRCRQTASWLAPGCPLIVDARLHEIDYGQAEGLGPDEVIAQFPRLLEAWSRGDDPFFPQGENTAAVAARLNAFLADLPETPSLVVTHNVVLRCLLGAGLGVPVALWHRIPVAHGELVEVLRYKGQTFLNLTQRQIERVADAISGYEQ